MIVEPNPSQQKGFAEGDSCRILNTFSYNPDAHNLKLLYGN